MQIRGVWILGLIVGLSPMLVSGQDGPPAPASQSAPAQGSPGQAVQAGQDQSPPAANTAAANSAAAPSGGVSESLKPAADSLRQTLDGLRLDKWKGGSVRSEATANVDSMQKDLQGALPRLMGEADAGPQTLGKLLPLARNVDALYDVLLRVVDGARVAANAEQVGQLQDAMTSLDKARRDLNDRMEALAAGQEKALANLQATVKSQAASPVCPVVAPATPAATSALSKKVIRKKPKPAAKPAAPAGSQPTGTQPEANKPSQ